MNETITPYVRMMDISLNLARMGNWTADSYETKKNLISRFLIQTDEYLQALLKDSITEKTREVLLRFEKEFKKMRSVKGDDFDKYDWAERALTWANILQHRAKLA